MEKPTSENQLTVIIGDALRMAHRKVNTGTLLSTVKYNPCRGRIFSPLCSVDLPPLLPPSHIPLFLFTT
jgi:hypothetical protein